MAQQGKVFLYSEMAGIGEKDEVFWWFLFFCSQVGNEFCHCQVLGMSFSTHEVWSSAKCCVVSFSASSCWSRFCELFFSLKKLLTFLHRNMQRGYWGLFPFSPFLWSSFLVKQQSSPDVTKPVWTPTCHHVGGTHLQTSSSGEFRYVQVPNKKKVNKTEQKHDQF